MDDTGTRTLSIYEQEAWDEYERVLDTIPNGRSYDRVSVMQAFPELQEAFDHCCAMSTYYKLASK